MAIKNIKDLFFNLSADEYGNTVIQLWADNNDDGSSSLLMATTNINDIRRLCIGLGTELNSIEFNSGVSYSAEIINSDLKGESSFEKLKTSGFTSVEKQKDGSYKSVESDGDITIFHGNSKEIFTSMGL